MQTDKKNIQKEQWGDLNSCVYMFVHWHECVPQPANRGEVLEHGKPSARPQKVPKSRWGAANQRDLVGLDRGGRLGPTPSNEGDWGSGRLELSGVVPRPSIPNRGNSTLHL